MPKPLGVGIVGVAPDRGWAAVAQIPALRALDRYEIQAVCTRRPDSARAAADHYGVPLAFADPAEMARHPDVDVVAVCVRAPGHYEVLKAALDAGKHIFCEWPLCVDINQSEEIAARARLGPASHMIALQAAASPMVRYARDLIDQGYVGQVLSVTLLSSWRLLWGAQTLAANAYTLDPDQGATALTIAASHCVDAMSRIVGNFDSLAANVAAPRRTALVVDTGETRPMTSAQQVSVSGRLQSGALATVHIQGGARNGTGLHLEINGTEGALRITSDGDFGVTNPDLVLLGGQTGEPVRRLEVPPACRRVPPALLNSRAEGTAELLIDFAEAIGSGAAIEADFDHALRLHRLIEAIQRASDTGRRQDFPFER